MDLWHHTLQKSPSQAAILFTLKAVSGKAIPSPAIDPLSTYCAFTATSAQYPETQDTIPISAQHSSKRLNSFLHLSHNSLFFSFYINHALTSQDQTFDFSHIAF